VHWRSITRKCSCTTGRNNALKEHTFQLCIGVYAYSGNCLGSSDVLT
jgi:hypothetical protein